MPAPTLLLAVDVHPFDILAVLFGLLAAITIGGLIVVLLQVVRTVAYALYQTLTGPVRVLRGSGGDDHDENEDDDAAGPNHPAVGGGHGAEHDPAPAAREPPPNRVWPPENAFNDNDR